MLHSTDFQGAFAPNSTLISVAWATLDAANDFRDLVVVEACRRVLDATYRGDASSDRDLSVVFNFFD